MEVWRLRSRLALAIAAPPSAALVALLAIACQGGEEAPSALTSTAAPSPTSAAPSATPEAETESRLIFLRPVVDSYYWGAAGVIHMSYDLAGSNVVQLTPGDVRASFVGLAEGNGTTVLYYIAAGEIRNVFTLEARDLGTGETTTLASIEPTEHGHLQEGSLSPGGRYVAWSHPDGVDLLDLTTDSRRRILTRKACGRYPASECYGYHTPTWSPDGRLLLVQKAFWEGAAAVVVDPFQESPQELPASLLGDQLPSFAAWSPAGDAWCGYGHYDSPSGLHLSRQPDWQPRDLLPEYETFESGTPERTVSDCAWLDEHRIAFVTVPFAQTQHSSTVSMYDLATAGVTEVADFGAASPELFPVPGTSTLVFNDRNGGQPGLLSTTDGTRTPILQPGDRVVAATQPVSLPEEMVAASPQLRPCVPLTAHCEAQVTNVAPGQLNIRKGPSQGTDVMGTLSEGEIVCLTGSSQFGEDGFRWWPVRSQGGVEGWVAQGDPQEPERPWLTPTGRKCENGSGVTPRPGLTVAADAPPTPIPSPALTSSVFGEAEVCRGGDLTLALLVTPSLLRGIRYAFWRDASAGLEKGDLP
jgi:hypothetical protein